MIEYIKLTSISVHICIENRYTRTRRIYFWTMVKFSSEKCVCWCEYYYLVWL